LSEPTVLELFSDYVCPWCYLGDNRVKKLAQAFDIEVRRVHFPLHPETPAEGRTLEELFRCGPEEVAAKNRNMQGLMAAEELPYGPRSHTYNSRLAQEVGTWAETQPGGSAIHDKFFEAYFVDNRNIGDVDVIVDIVRAAGLNEGEARTVIEERRYKDAVDADWAKSGQYGVTGVPTFVAGGHGLVGAQPYETLEQFMLSLGTQRRDPAAD